MRIEVLIFKGVKMPGLTETTTFNGDISTTFGVISDYTAYPDILADIDKAEVLESKRNVTVVRFDLKIVKSFFYTLEIKTKKNKEIKWSLVESDIMKKNNGQWTFTEIDENETEAEYNIDVTFGLLVPKMVINSVVRGNLPKMFSQFNEAIENA